MKLIDKNAVVAMIRHHIKEEPHSYFCKCLLSEIDSLKVKETDSKLTLEDVSMIRQIMFDYNRQVRNEMSIPNNEDYCKEVLNRFKAQKGE